MINMEKIILNLKRMLCQFNELLKAQLIEKMSIKDVLNLSLVNKTCYDKFFKSKKWSDLVWKIFRKQSFNMNPIIDYFQNRTGAFGLGQNKYMEIGPKGPVIQWKYLISNVRRVILDQGISVYLTYDGDLYTCGEYPNIQYTELKLVANNVIDMSIFASGIFYIKEDNKLYSFTGHISKSFLDNISHIVNDQIFIGQDKIFSFNIEINIESDNIYISTKQRDNIVYTIDIIINGEEVTNCRYLSRDYIITMENELYNLNESLLVATNVKKFIEYIDVIVWLDFDGQLNWLYPNGLKHVEKFTDRLIDFSMDGTQTTRLLLFENNQLQITDIKSPALNILKKQPRINNVLSAVFSLDTIICIFDRLTINQ